MDEKTLQQCIVEAGRFILKANKAIERLKADKYASIIGAKETAAARRASMDLTRALADLRQGR